MAKINRDKSRNIFDVWRFSCNTFRLTSPNKSKSSSFFRNPKRSVTKMTQCKDRPCGASLLLWCDPLIKPLIQVCRSANVGNNPKWPKGFCRPTLKYSNIPPYKFNGLYHCRVELLNLEVLTDSKADSRTIPKGPLAKVFIILNYLLLFRTKELPHRFVTNFH